MKKITVNELITEINTRLATSLFGGEGFISVLHHDVKEQKKVFRSLLLQAITKYETHFRPEITQKIEISNTTTSSLTNGYIYTFEDNFDKYLQGLISENEIVLVPSNVLALELPMSLSRDAKYYRYDKPKLYSKIGGAQTVRYNAYHPYHIEFDNDGDFTELSSIYYVSSSDNAFIVKTSITVLEYLIRQSRNIDLGLPVEILNPDSLNTTLEELATEYELLVKTRSTSMRSWGLGGI